jgi:predicted transcriptional regulator
MMRRMKRGTKLMEPISIRLEAEVKEALQELAEADERSLSSFINRILRNYVESVRGKRPPKAKG